MKTWLYSHNTHEYLTMASMSLFYDTHCRKIRKRLNSLLDMGE